LSVRQHSEACLRRGKRTVKKHPAVVVAMLLVIVAAILIGYRVVKLGYPLLPTASVKVWQLSIEGLLKGNEKAVSVRLGVPATRGTQTVTEERVISGGLNFNILRDGPDQVGVWSGDTGPTGTVIHYRASILVKPARAFRVRVMEPEPYPPSFSESERALAARLAARWARLSQGDLLYAVCATVSGKWGEPEPDRKDIEEWAELVAREGRTTALLGLFRAADLAARLRYGLIFEEGITRTPLHWISVWTGTQWAHVQPDTGAVYHKSISFLPLTGGDTPPISAVNGSAPEVRYSLSQQIVSQWIVYFDHIRIQDRLLNRWSLFSLPPEFQGTFRILLLVPIGALMVCVLRNIIGFPTFGIFMPVLMALAFRSTGLGYGIAIFSAVILVGYLIRLALDKLHLLLVPRLSVILTVVIGCFAFLAVLGNKLGIRELMSVGLLPFVILTMMIERFFVIVEESGVREGLRNAVGSAAVAAITHLIVHIETLQLTFFIYPELLLALAALQILLGRYTGYRLSEVLRFRALRRS
jgi:hypothetical protein